MLLLHTYMLCTLLLTAVLPAVCCKALEATLACPLKSKGLYPTAMALLRRFLLPRTNVSTLTALVSLTFAIIVQRTFGFGLPATFAVLAPRATALQAAVPVDMGANLPTDNAFRLQQYRDVVELQTAAYKVTPRRFSVPTIPLTASAAGSTSSTSSRALDRDGTAQDVEILLVSMVHLADQAYYREIMRDASSYDRVLFELIAGSDVSELDQAGNRAVTEYMYPTREQVRERCLENITVHGTCCSGMTEHRRHEAVYTSTYVVFPSSKGRRAFTRTTAKMTTYKCRQLAYVGRS